MKNKTRIIFIITTLIIISLPIIFFNSKKTVSEKEKRTLAEKPKIIKDNHLNGKIFTEYDDYFQDHLGLRDQLIQIDTCNPCKIKVSTTIGRAIEGKNGWYFYTDPSDGNNLMDFYKRNLFNEIQIEQFSKKICETVEWCKEQNIDCIFLIGPNKHTIYGENYPYERPDGITRADQITQIFNTLGVNYVFPRDYIVSKKREFNYPLYYETDTHWNQAGAYLASTLLKEKIQNIFPETKFPEIEYDISIYESETGGDLLPMLKLAQAKSTQISLTPIGHSNNDFYSYVTNEGRDNVHTKGANKRLPRALIYRDSFFSALEPFVSPLFSEAEYHWKNFETSDKDYVLKYKPDIIIFESVERYAPTIVN